MFAHCRCRCLCCNAARTRLSFSPCWNRRCHNHSYSTVRKQWKTGHAHPKTHRYECTHNFYSSLAYRLTYIKKCDAFDEVTRKEIRREQNFTHNKTARQTPVGLCDNNPTATEPCLRLNSTCDSERWWMVRPYGYTIRLSKSGRSYTVQLNSTDSKSYAESDNF